MWSVLSQDSEIGCISRMNWWNELIFCMLVQLRKAKSYLNDFWVGMIRNRHGHLVLETQKSAVSKEWVHEFSWFFACWLWGSNFWLNQHHTLYLLLLNASLLQLYLLDPWQYLEGSHEIGSVHLSILSSLGLFSWN